MPSGWIPSRPWSSFPDLIEAAARRDELPVARAALERLVTSRGVRPRAVLGGVQLGLDEGADVAGALRAGQAAVEDDLAHLMVMGRGGDLGLEDVVLWRVEQAGVEFGLGDLAGDSSGGGDEQLVEDPGWPGCAQIKHELHLDQPLYLQYSHWAWNVLHGNLGYDYYKGEPVSSAIAQAAPTTISLVLGAAVLWISYGIFSGWFRR